MERWRFKPQEEMKKDKRIRTLNVEVPYSLVALAVSEGTLVMFDINSSRKWQLCSRWVVLMITCTNYKHTKYTTVLGFSSLSFHLNVCILHRLVSSGRSCWFWSQCVKLLYKRRNQRVSSKKDNCYCIISIHLDHY